MARRRRYATPEETAPVFEDEVEPDAGVPLISDDEVSELEAEADVAEAEEREQTLDEKIAEATRRIASLAKASSADDAESARKVRLAELKERHVQAKAEGKYDDGAYKAALEEERYRIKNKIRAMRRDLKIRETVDPPMVVVVPAGERRRRLRGRHVVLLLTTEELRALCELVSLVDQVPGGRRWVDDHVGREPLADYLFRCEDVQAELLSEDPDFGTETPIEPVRRTARPDAVKAVKTGAKVKR